MRQLSQMIVAASLVALLLALPMPAQEPGPAAPTPDVKPAVAGPEVTLTGMMMNDWVCTRNLTIKDRQAESNVPVIFALDGPPDVLAAFKDIFKELIAGSSINYEQAKTIEEEMNKRLKYYITPGALIEETKNAWRGSNGGGAERAVTGILSEKDGKKWITPSRIEDRINGKPVRINYPAGFYAPDKPFKMTGKNLLILKVTDTLSLKCILVPRGQFMSQYPFYLTGRHDDEFPRHVTLTKPFWLAEIPVTQEMWDAVMGAENDFSTIKDPQRPVRNSWCKDINKFCRILAEKNGRKLRLPGEDEWDYVAKVGTSNPPFAKKYKAQYSAGKTRGECLPVKAREPNAWGFYDLASGGFEVTRDKGDLSKLHDRQDRVDPYDSCEADEAAGKKHMHWGKTISAYIGFHETIGQIFGPEHCADTAYGSTKIRIAVDATPEEVAEMEKAEKSSKK